MVKLLSQKRLLPNATSLQLRPVSAVISFLLLSTIIFCSLFAPSASALLIERKEISEERSNKSILEVIDLHLTDRTSIDGGDPLVNMVAVGTQIVSLFAILLIAAREIRFEPLSLIRTIDPRSIWSCDLSPPLH